MSNDFLAAAAEWLNEEELFRQSLERTARDYGFAAELIEKDVFSSLVLAVLAANAPESLVFKGGTCLSKVYMNFYRLSEDLDFSIPVSLESSRAERRRIIQPVKVLCDDITDHCPQVVVLDPLRGANQSTQYIQTMGYRSRISGRMASIKVEFGLREPGLMAPGVESAETLLVSPLTGRTVFPLLPVRVMALQEMWAEKIRAAFCRREPAIRDFFDLDYALRDNRLDPEAIDLITLVGKKLAVPGTGPINLSAKKRAELQHQKESTLKPVLRARDFDQFDLAKIWTVLKTLAKCLEKA